MRTLIRQIAVLVNEYFDQPQAERDDDHEFIFFCLSCVAIIKLFASYPAIANLAGINLALIFTFAALIWIFCIGIWPTLTKPFRHGNTKA